LADRSSVALDPRKLPVQTRSMASVDAILTATVQILSHVGKDRLTTRMVADRAGVSVGTLYQYFPNKSALLRAILERHLLAVTATVENTCREQHAQPLSQMATALITAFLEVKMRDVKTSAALYAISSDLDGMNLVKQMGKRSNQAIVEMLSTATEPLRSDPQIIAEVLQGALTGVTRSLLDSEAPEMRLEIFRNELIVFACAYLEKVRTETLHAKSEEPSS
jgi:AcrR family transcriptional regulator